MYICIFVHMYVETMACYLSQTRSSRPLGNLRCVYVHIYVCICGKDGILDLREETQPASGELEVCTCMFMYVCIYIYLGKMLKEEE